jgi:hypothetical protein
VGYGPFETADILYNDGVKSKSINNVVAGYYNLKIDGIDGWKPEDIFKSFCVDVFDNVPNTNPSTYNLVSLDEVPKKIAGPMGGDRATRLKKLWANYYLTNFTNQQAAAFQLAVWEIVYDDSLNLKGGFFTVNSAGSGTIDLAQGWLDNLSNLSNEANISAVTSNTYQDFVAPSPVPEPASIF